VDRADPPRPGEFQLNLTHDADSWGGYTYLLGETSAGVGGFEVFDGPTRLGQWLLTDAFAAGEVGRSHVNGLTVSERGEVVISELTYDAVLAVDGDPASPTFLQLQWHAVGSPGGQRPAGARRRPRRPAGVARATQREPRGRRAVGVRQPQRRRRPARSGCSSTSAPARSPSSTAGRPGSRAPTRAARCPCPAGCSPPAPTTTASRCTATAKPPPTGRCGPPATAGRAGPRPRAYPVIVE
jgi:hypothetical protein